ncbi:aminopeptidase P family protein [Mesorhizobium sp. M2A.F.Ca.ET.046.02.1.1]|nr:aminopeptidase P family protein [Mesorhizobium sp. M2A.F.Ca.ET.046.02.1.1]
MTLEKGPQAFPREEYLRRISAVKLQMARLEIEALFVSNPANVTYLTGCTVWGGPQGLVVSIAREEPTFIIRGVDWAAGIYQSFLERENLITYPENRRFEPGVDGYDAVIDFLHDAGLANRGVGLEMNHLPAQTAEKFRKRLPQARIVDSNRAVDWVRLIKSNLEISVIKEAAAIADAAMVRATEVIRADVRESDVVAEIVATQVRGVNGKPSTGFTPIGPLFLCSSPRTGVAHYPWSEGTIRPGSQINLEVTGVRHGYVAALMRTFSLGAPSDRLRRLHEAELAGLEAALNTVRPRVTCSDVGGAFYNTIEKLGFKKDTRCGYSIGINWTEPNASFDDGDKTELKPNMVFHLMLGNWMEEDFGYVISEMIRVTESGVEVLTNTPRKLFVV